MTKEELIDQIEMLVEDYFKDNNESVNEIYTIRDYNNAKISIDIKFNKYY